MSLYPQNNYNHIPSNSQLYKPYDSPFNTFTTRANIIKPTHNPAQSTINKYVSNVSPLSSTMSFQDRVIAFGQDRDENYFKQTLRKSPGAALKSNYYNIINTFSPTNGSFTKKNIPSSRHPQMNSAIQHISNFFNQPHNDTKIGKISKYNSFNQINPLQMKSEGRLEKKSKDIKEYHELYSSAVIEYSYLEDPNIYNRDHMEDKGQAVDCFNDNPTDALFSLFDGHGGGEVSKFLQENLSLAFKSMLPSSNIEGSIMHLFDVLDEKIRLSNYSNVGSTACMVYLTLAKDTNKRMLYCANVGDTRCVLVSKTCAKRLSYDHRATDQREAERIIKAGGLVFEGRVYGQLMLSRSFGDFEFKPYGVIGVPDITKLEIDTNDQYIIIASDGVWDVLADEDMFKMSLQINNSKDFVQKIIKEAMLKGTMDNISCFVIKLN